MKTDIDSVQEYIFCKNEVTFLSEENVEKENSCIVAVKIVQSQFIVIS